MSNQIAKYEQPSLTPTILDMLLAVVDSSEKMEVKKAELVKKVIFAYENNLPISTALNGGLYVVNGRLTVEGNVIAAQIKRHPDYDYAIKDHDNSGCTIEIYKNGELVGSARFDEDDAKLAKLLAKDTYKSFPREMYFNKAMSRAFKWFCPEIFSNSVYVHGEIEGDLATLNGGEDIYEGEILAPADAFNSLCEQYGHDTVFNACGGIIPTTADGIAGLATKLGESKDD